MFNIIQTILKSLQKIIIFFLIIKLKYTIIQKKMHHMLVLVLKLEKL